MERGTFPAPSASRAKAIPTATSDQGAAAPGNPVDQNEPP